MRSRSPGRSGTSRPRRVTILNGPFEPLGRVVLQLFDLAPDLSTRKYSMRARAYHATMRVASTALTRSVVSRNHSSGSAVGRLFLAHGWTARPARRLVAQCHLGDARRPAVLAGLFAGLRPRAQPLHLDPGVAAGRRVAHLVEQMARDRLPVGRLLLAEDAVAFARTSKSTCGACARRAMNRSRKSASRSIAHTTRAVAAACAQSRSPSIQRNDFRSSRGFGVGSPSAAGFGGAGASKAARSTFPVGIDRQRSCAAPDRGPRRRSGSNRWLPAPASGHAG